MATKMELLGAHSVPHIRETKPEVFIIESLDKKDEQRGHFEGRVLSDMLRLSGKNPKYYYFQSKEELPHLVGLFRQSQYRYLHMSSHASGESVGVTDGHIPYADFALHFDGHLKLRRLFFSACQVGNARFVAAIAAQNEGMHSIAAPSEDIQFDHAAAIWSAFYVSVFSRNEKSMTSIDIKARLRSLRSLFPVDFYFASYHAALRKWRQGLVGAVARPRTRRSRRRFNTLPT